MAITKDDIESCKVGDTGTAYSPLIPSGVVEINGQRFSARAKGPSISEGATVVIVGGDVGGVVVQRSSESDAELPEFGKVVYGSFGDRAIAIALRAEEERSNELAAWKNRARIQRRILGIVFGGFAMFVFSHGENDVMLGNVFAFIIGFAWANAVFLTLDSMICRFDEELVRLVTPASVASLVGSAIGLAAATYWGWAAGVCLAVAGALIGGVIVPIVGCLVLSDGQN